jgi:septal ring factor EnvC (AmiA/AmiB activator)
MLDDVTLREVFHIRLSAMSAISMLAVFFVILIVLLSLLIVYTPVRNIMPGYSASVRQQLIDETARVDSLQTNLNIQRQYLDVLKQVTAGDIRLDSAQNLDSLQLIERAQILEMNSEVTDAFMEQYERKERDRLLLFDNAANHTVYQLARPVRGVIIQSASVDSRQFGVTVRTVRNENVLSMMHGTIISAERMADNTFTVVLQNGSFMAIYRHVPKLMKQQGAQVEKGEIIGLQDAEHDLVLELWDAGQFVNPEEVIVW